MKKFCCWWIYWKIYTYPSNKITTSRSIRTPGCEWPRWKKDEVWYILVDTYVANDVVFIRQKVLFFSSKKYFIIVSLLKHFFFCNVPEKSTQSDQICRDIRRVFLRERRARQWTARFIFWYLLFIFKNVVWWRHVDIWLMGNDSFPHTSRLSLQICKSCLICPKQSQEETTALMPLKSGH